MSPPEDPCEPLCRMLKHTIAGRMDGFIGFRENQLRLASLSEDWHKVVNTNPSVDAGTRMKNPLSTIEHLIVKNSFD